MRILIVESHSGTSSHLMGILSEQGYAVDHARSSAEGDWLARNAPYDLVVMNVMLPDGHGLEACKSLRNKGLSAPLLLVALKPGDGDKVRALDAGADALVAFPVRTDEFLAQVRALLRRGQASEAVILRHRDLEMDLQKRAVTRAARRLKLLPKEFALLEYFLRNPGKVLTRTAIGEHVWDMNFDAESNTIASTVCRLRKKLGKPPLIKTCNRTGYRLE